MGVHPTDYGNGLQTYYDPNGRKRCKMGGTVPRIEICGGGSLIFARVQSVNRRADGAIKTKKANIKFNVPVIISDQRQFLH